MNRVYERRLSQLVNTHERQLLQNGKIGLEKESLRVGEDGLLAQTPHPYALGSTLTHPSITTDYSEALLEFITPPSSQISEVMRFMQQIHQFCHRQLHDELLWAASMPCVVDGEKSVPIAWYGRSNQGMIKHVYRRGLGHRYGKVMQVIAGIHFNYSLPESFWPVFQSYERDNTTLQSFKTQSYFALVRNVQRFGWLLYYLFGASPAVCKSFLKGRTSHLAEYDANTAFLPYATSLRMSDLGYTNTKRCSLKMSYDNLESYAAGLQHAITTSCPPYEEIGVKVNGEYRQLNANILQIENEYYNIMRPKQPPQNSERTLQALLNRGVEYVELRSNDVGIFEPLSVNETQMRFLEAFLIFCLLYESPPINADEQVNIELNQLEVARNGRDPALQLHDGQQKKSFKSWAGELCTMLQGICELLDDGQAEPLYQRSLQQQLVAIEDPAKTPSAQVMAAMKESGMGFFHFVKMLSKQHQEYFLAQPFPRELQSYFEDLARQSHQQQAELEATDTLSFDDYLQQYLAR